MLTNTSQKRANTFYLFFVAIYFILVIAVYLVMPESKHIAPDSPGYLDLAEKIVVNGGVPVALRLPGYPMFLSFFLNFDSILIPSIVFVQATFSLLSAWLALRLSKIFSPGYEIPVFFLMLFNPYGLLASQLILPENLFALCVAFQAFCLFSFTKTAKKFDLLAAGLAVVVAVFVRANGIIMIAGGVITILFLFPSPESKLNRKTAVSIFLLPSVLLLLWGGYIYKVTGTASLISPEYARFEAYETLRYLDIMLNDSTDKDSASSVNSKLYDLTKDTVLLDPSKKDAHYMYGKQMFWKVLSGYNAFDVVRALAKSLVLYVVSTGSTLITYCLDIPPSSDGFLGIGMLIVVIFLRVFDVIGCYYAIKRKDKQMLVFIFVYIVVFLSPIGFFGMARYRFPVEFAYIILACYGLFRLRQTQSTDHLSSGSDTRYVVKNVRQIEEA